MPYLIRQQQQVAARRDRDRHIRQRGPLLVRRRHLGELAKVPAAQLQEGQGLGRRPLPQGFGPAVTTKEASRSAPPEIWMMFVPGVTFPSQVQRFTS